MEPLQIEMWHDHLENLAIADQITTAPDFGTFQKERNWVEILDVLFYGSVHLPDKIFYDVCR